MKKGKLIWSEEFDYTGKPSETIWSYDLGPWKPNNELEYYTDRLENAYVSDSVLHIVAKKENYETRKYTSARIKSRHKVDIKYGTIDICAKVPTGRGCWPAIWMMATEEKHGHWPNSGEIDIMEFVGGDTRVQSALHTKGYSHVHKNERIGFSKEGFDPTVFHVFTFEWKEDYIAFYLDGEKYYEVSYVPKQNEEKWLAWPFNEEFYFILNLAVGGFLGSRNGIDDDAFPQEFLVDYIRVYEQE